MERVLLHKVSGDVPRIERVKDPELVFCGCVEPVESTRRELANPVGIVRAGCELCGGRGLVSVELAAMFIGALVELELEEAGTP